MQKCKDKVVSTLQMEEIGDEIYELGIAELARREREVRAFEESVRAAQKAAQDKGIAEVGFSILPLMNPVCHGCNVGVASPVQ